MKTYRHLYPQVYAWENLELAYRRARKGKRARKPAAALMLVALVPVGIVSVQLRPPRTRARAQFA